RLNRLPVACLRRGDPRPPTIRAVAGARHKGCRCDRDRLDRLPRPNGDRLCNVDVRSPADECRPQGYHDLPDPPIAILLGWVILGETQSWLAIAGGALCLVGAYLACHD